jgi:hypothetical protein
VFYHFTYINAQLRLLIYLIIDYKKFIF